MVSFTTKICLAIVSLIGLSAISYYESTIPSLWLSNTLPYTPWLLLIFSVILAMCAVFTAVGYIAIQQGFTQEGLEKIGDDAIAGKPPL